MVCAQASGTEKLRVSTLHRYGILDTEREVSFDDLARLAATACGAPFAWVAFVNGDRLWFKSTVGFERDDMPRVFALCDDVLKQSGVFVVRDALEVEEYADSPLVAGEPYARFYAACPLVSPDGYALGCIAVAGREPRDLEPAQADALRALARQLILLLEARLAEALHRRALEHASDIIYMTDEGGLFTFVNPVAVRILGYDTGELLGRHYLELIRPDFRRAVEGFYADQFRLRERTTYFEFPALAKDGSEVWFGQNVRILTEGRRVTGFHAVARDITRRKRVQDALRQSEERLRQALQAAGGGVWDYDLRTEKFTWSDDLYRLLGLEPGGCEPTVENWLRCVHPEDRDRASEIVGAALRSYDDLEVEYRVVLPGGVVRWLHGKGKKITDEAGGPLGYVGVALCVTTRKRAEEEARSAAEYANLFRYANDSILVIDPEGGEILDVNEKACEVYGLGREDFVVVRLASISADPARELELFAGRAPSGEGLEFEAEHLGCGGRRIRLLVNASFIDYRGRRAVLCINRDVTGRRLQEEALRRSEAKYRQLIEQASDGIAVFTKDGTIVEANDRVCEITGASCDELVGSNVAEYFLPEDLEADPIRFGELLSGRRLMTERSLLRRDGTTVPVEITARMMTGGDETILAIVRDVTERKRAEELLRAADRRAVEEYEQLLGRLADLALSFGAARDLLTVYRGLRDFCLSLTPSFALVICRYDEAAGVRHCVYFQLADEENTSPEMGPIPVREGPVGRLVKTGEVVISNDYLSELAGREHVGYGFEKDERRPRSALIAPMSFMGRVVGTVEVQSYDLAAYGREHATAVRLAANLAAVAVENVRLLEREREKEQRLLQAQKAEALGSLAGGVAHDFNNILTGVFGFTDLALRHVEAMERGGKSELTKRLREELEEVKLSGRRGADLTRQLLAFSRQQQLERRPVDIHHTVTNLLGMLRRIIEENVTIHFHPAAERSTVFADAGQIEQVLVNLAANARDAMPKGGRVVIETANVTLDDAYAERHPYARAGRYVRLSVSDTGTGMPEEVRRRVFEPFFTTKDVNKGTGLGLSTAYGIIKQHNGTIEVYSEPGHGTTFRIYLPLESGPAEEAAEAEPPQLAGGHETILVVEDDEALARLARRYLEELGYRVIFAKDGRDAVKVYEARHREIDLILMDVIMPGLDGPEALREMRELVPGTAPVVFMTGYSPEVVRARLEEELNAGAGLLPKPYTLAEIGAKVREALDARRGGGA
ncbi:MAG TPA: PAS domain S-box protein [Pyrinomonadaceae bacterium]|nr:PAS domain S-box protein [Pyrinomonadaceae bacterium]